MTTSMSSKNSWALMVVNSVIPWWG